MKRRRTRAGSRSRPRSGIWVDEPKKPGSKDERYSVDLESGKRRRLRPTRHKGAVVNESLTITCPKWIDDECKHCEVCGERSDQVSLGVTWLEGEIRVQNTNPDGGGWRSRGPVLWAMHVIKLERFAERHLECGYWASRRDGGDIPSGQTLPQYLIWNFRFGTEDELRAAIERAERAGVSAVQLREQIGVGEEEEEEIPF